MDYYASFHILHVSYCKYRNVLKTRILFLYKWALIVILTFHDLGEEKMSLLLHYIFKRYILNAKLIVYSGTPFVFFV